MTRVLVAWLVLLCVWSGTDAKSWSFGSFSPFGGEDDASRDEVAAEDTDDASKEEFNEHEFEAPVGGEPKWDFAASDDNSTQEEDTEQETGIATLQQELIRKVGDVAGVLERLQSEWTDNLDFADHQRRIRQVRIQQLRVTEAFSTLVEQASIAARNTKGIVTLKPTDSPTLSHVFFSGDPFLVQCAGLTDPIDPTLLEAIPDLLSQGITTVALDCHGRLPSGKTTVQRFFKSYAKEGLPEPFFFTVANRQSPRSFSFRSAWHMTPSTLVDFAVRATSPIIHNVTDNGEFNAHCLKHKLCSVLVFHNEVTLEQWDVLSSIIKRFRQTSFVGVNATITRLSFEDAIPKTDAPGLVVIQPNKKKWSGKAYRGDFTSKGVGDFLDSAVRGELSLASLKAKPRASPRPVKKDAKDKTKDNKKDKTKTSGGFKKNKRRDPIEVDGGKSGHDIDGEHPQRVVRRKPITEKVRDHSKKGKQAKKPREDKESEAERLARRRREMEEEAAEFEPIEHVGEGGGGEEEEEEEEETIDVDEQNQEEEREESQGRQTAEPDNDDDSDDDVEVTDEEDEELM